MAKLSLHVFMDRGAVKVHKHARLIPNHLDRPNLVSNRFILWYKENRFLREAAGNPVRVRFLVWNAWLANQNAGIGSSGLLAKIAM